MISISKPDGVLEYSASGCCCPPGKPRKGQHTNSTTSWYRINKGKWKRCRSYLGFKTIADVAATCKEFSAMIIT